MSFYLDYYRKLLLLTEHKKIFYLFPFLFIISAILDVFSIGIILNFFKILTNEQDNYLIKYLLLINPNFSKKELLIIILSSLLIIFVIKSVLSILIRVLISAFSLKNYSYLQIKLLQNYLNLDFEEFQKRNKSEYTSNVKEISGNMSGAIEYYLKAIGEIFIICVIVIYLLYINFFLTSLLIVIFGFLTLIYLKLLRPINIKFGDEKNKFVQFSYKLIESSLNGFKEIKLLNKSFFFLKIFKDAYKKIYINEIKSSALNNSVRYVAEFLLLLFFILFFLILTILKYNFEAIIALSASYAFASIRIIPGITAVISSAQIVQYYYSSLIIISNDFERLNNKMPSKIKYLKKFKSIDFINASFKYNNSKSFIFKNLNLKIKAGDSIGIIGPSGIGKTTLIDVICGFLKISSGKILLNGKPEDSLKNIQNITSYMPQEPLIMEDSIFNNITLYENKKLINYKKIISSIKNASLNNDYNKSDNYLEKKIGVDTRLSLGQKRRISLARTLYHNREILVLDEMTASLDDENEKYIILQIKKILKKKTIIIISHNPKVLKICKNIYRFKDKKLIKVK
jgi:ABC-type multidrug transport system fused ATPase/permease subunit